MILLENDVLSCLRALVHGVDVAGEILVERIVDDPFVGDRDAVAAEMPELAEARFNGFWVAAIHRVEVRARIGENKLRALGVITELAVVERGGHFGVGAESEEAPLGNGK